MGYTVHACTSNRMDCTESKHGEAEQPAGEAGQVARKGCILRRDAWDIEQRSCTSSR
jgi:hypothetical protein